MAGILGAKSPLFAEACASVARPNRRFPHSPIDALAHRVVGFRLRCRIPVRFDFHPVILRHIRYKNNSNSHNRYAG